MTSRTEKMGDIIRLQIKKLGTIVEQPVPFGKYPKTKQVRVIGICQLYEAVFGKGWYDREHIVADNRLDREKEALDNFQAAFNAHYYAAPREEFSERKGRNMKSSIKRITCLRWGDSVFSPRFQAELTLPELATLIKILEPIAVKDKLVHEGESRLPPSVSMYNSFMKTYQAYKNKTLGSALKIFDEE